MQRTGSVCMGIPFDRFTDAKAQSTNSRQKAATVVRHFLSLTGILTTFSQRYTMLDAGRRWGEFSDSSIVRPCAQSRSEIEFPRARAPYYGRTRIFSFDSAARRCAPVEGAAFPRRLRPPSLMSRCTASYVRDTFRALRTDRSCGGRLPMNVRSLAFRQMPSIR